jgi:hypothetical protein
VKLWAVVAIVAIACGVAIGAVLWSKLPAHESRSRSWTIQRDDGGGEGVKRDGGSDAVRP